MANKTVEFCRKKKKTPEHKGSITFVTKVETRLLISGRSPEFSNCPLKSMEQ